MMPKTCLAVCLIIVVSFIPGIELTGVPHSPDLVRWVDELIKHGRQSNATGYHAELYFPPQRLPFSHTMLTPYNQTNRPVNKLQFVKTHKTGSSTLQGIFFRQAFYGSVPMKIYLQGNHYLDLNKAVAAVQNGETWDLVFKHVLVRDGDTHNDLKRYMNTLAPGGLLTTIARDPVSRRLSGLFYFDLTGKRKFETMDDAGIVEELMKKVSRDSMGLDMHIEKNLTIPQMLEKIDGVDILLANRFDESLVLRHFLWGWPLEDMLYVRLNSCGGLRYDNAVILCPPPSFKDNLPKELAEKIIRQSPLDTLFYQRAVDRHESLIAQIDPKAWKTALDLYTNMNNDINAICKKTPTPKPTSVAPAPGTLTYNNILADPVQYCAYLTMSDLKMLELASAYDRALRRKE